MARSGKTAAVLRHFNSLPTETFNAGTTIIAKGALTGKVFVLEEGAVEVVQEGTVIASIDEPGVIIGELAALLEKPHSADVRAVETSTFRVADATRLLRTDPVATLHIAEVLARRLDRANKALVSLRREVAAGTPRDAIDTALGQLAEAIRQDGEPQLAAFDRMHQT